MHLFFFPVPFILSLFSLLMYLFLFLVPFFLFFIWYLCCLFILLPFIPWCTCSFSLFLLYSNYLLTWCTRSFSTSLVTYLCSVLFISVFTLHLFTCFSNHLPAHLFAHSHSHLIIGSPLNLCRLLIWLPTSLPPSLPPSSPLALFIFSHAVPSIPSHFFVAVLLFLSNFTSSFLPFLHSFLSFLPSFLLPLVSSSFLILLFPLLIYFILTPSNPFLLSFSCTLPSVPLSFPSILYLPSFLHHSLFSSFLSSYTSCLLHPINFSLLSPPLFLLCRFTNPSIHLSLLPTLTFVLCFWPSTRRHSCILTGSKLWKNLPVNEA